MPVTDDAGRGRDLDDRPSRRSPEAAEAAAGWGVADCRPRRQRISCGTDDMTELRVLRSRRGSVVSAGIRHAGPSLEVLLVHPGAPTGEKG